MDQQEIESHAAALLRQFEDINVYDAIAIMRIALAYLGALMEKHGECTNITATDASKIINVTVVNGADSANAELPRCTQEFADELRDKISAMISREYQIPLDVLLNETAAMPPSIQVQSVADMSEQQKAERNSPIITITYV